MRYDDLYDLIEVLCEREIKEYSEINSCSLNLEKSELEDIFYQKFEIDIDQLYKLIEALIPLCTIVKSNITEKWYRGFGIDNMWLIKQEIK